MIWDPLERLLWGMAIMLWFFGVVKFISRARQTEDFNEKTIMYGFAVFLLGFAISRCFIYLSDFLIPGNYINNVYYGDFDAAFLKSDYAFLYRCNYIALSIGTLLFILTFEIIYKRTKYLLTIIQIPGIIILIILPWDLAYTYYGYFGFFSILFLIITFLYTRWSQIELKPIASLILLGGLLIYLAATLSRKSIKSYNVFPLILAPIFGIIGILIFISPLIVDPNYFLRTPRVWLFLCILSIFLIFILFSYSLVYGHYYYVVQSLIIILLVILVSYEMIRAIRLQSSSEIGSESKEEHPDVFSLITRPQKVTEEEISVSKEKGICLVCKGRVGGIMFMCASCGTFYCIKCSEALSNLENACWACNEAIDKSKPVRLNNSEQEKVLVEKEMGEGYKNSK
ncbi:hypothetical protein ES703_48725 [subsurface metagenome]